MLKAILGGLYKIQWGIIKLIPPSRRQKLLNWRLTWHIRYLPTYINLYVWKRTPIVVYQMSKVGSSSIYHSLLSHGLFTLHCHYLRPSVTESRKSAVKYPAQVQGRHWAWIYKNFVEKKRPAKFITLVRDPIAQAVSQHFQGNRAFFFGNHSNVSLDEIEAEFSTRLDKILIERTNWFDTEFNPVLDIDIFATPFDASRGYAHIQKGVYEVLILRLETADAIKEQAIAEFVGAKHFKLIKANVAEEQVYADLYRQFKQRVIIPKEVLDRVYDSKLAGHFYTTEERAAFKAKWLKNHDRE
jgi:hypothetical protein